MPPSHSRILVVDDQLINIRLLQRKLESNGMEVISATNGQEALEEAFTRKPDVVLLDIMMPGMDGIEVCRQLKQKESTRDIPVIFITARTSKEGKLEGLDVGAADYLIKPIDLDETVARVRTQLRIIQQHQENIRLTKELEQSNRRTALMNLTEGIAHNMNNLLGVMVGYVSLLKSGISKDEKLTRNCERLEAAVQRMTRIVHQLTVISHFQSLNTTSVPLNKSIHGAIHRFQRIIRSEHAVDIQTDLPDDFTFVTNAELFESAFERLLQNAYESYGSNSDQEMPQPDRPVEWHIAFDDPAEPQALVLKVMDRGQGIEPSIRDSVFEPFVSSSSVIGRGMGLTIVRHGIQSMGGSIELLDRESGGTQAVVRLPLNLEIREASDETA